MSDDGSSTEAVETVTMTAEQPREAEGEAKPDGSVDGPDTVTMSMEDIRRARDEAAAASFEGEKTQTQTEVEGLEANHPSANTARADAANRAGGVDPDQIRLPQYPKDHTPAPVEFVTLSAGRGGGPLARVDPGADFEALTLPEGVWGELERHLARGEIREAIAAAPALQDGETLTDDDAQTRSLLARAHLMEGDLESAAAAIGPFRDDLRLVLADASMCIAEGNIQRAQLRVTAALDENPKGLAEHYVAALLRVAQGRLEEASSLLTQVARSLPEHAVARHQLGQIVQVTGDPARAGTLFEMASVIAPRFLPPAMALAEMLAESRQYAEAMGIIAELTERMPEMLAPRLLRLRILLEVGEAPTALSLADALRQAVPGNAEVELYWAEAAFRTGRTDDARQCLTEVAKAATGEAQAKAYRLLGKIEQELGDVSAAMDSLSKAVEAAPASGELVLELCQLQLASADADSATAVLEAYAERPDADVGSLLSAAVLAQNHGLGRVVRLLGESALSRVIGTSSESQVRAVLGSIGGPMN